VLTPRSSVLPRLSQSAYLYEKGRAGKVDLTQAFRWYRAEPSRETPPPNTSSDMYELALGVKRDYLEAATGIARQPNREMQRQNNSAPCTTRFRRPEDYAQAYCTVRRGSSWRKRE